MGILTRFADIISSNINALLDKAEDPAKMIDQYLRNMLDDLAEVKQETAGVMAEESRTKRLADENAKEVAKYAELAKKALMAGSEADAKVFLTKKQELESVGAGLQTSAAVAHENAVKMRQMHDKLASDIASLRSRSESIKAKVSVAKTQAKINQMNAGAKTEGAISAFERMEDKADKMLDEANAVTELNSAAVDEAQALEDKYKAGDVNASVDAELAEMKAKLGL